MEVTVIDAVTMYSVILQTIEFVQDQRDTSKSDAETRRCDRVIYRAER